MGGWVWPRHSGGQDSNLSTWPVADWNIPAHRLRDDVCPYCHCTEACLPSESLAYSSVLSHAPQDNMRRHHDTNWQIIQTPHWDKECLYGIVCGSCHVVPLFPATAHTLSDCHLETHQLLAQKCSTVLSAPLQTHLIKNSLILKQRSFPKSEHYFYSLPHVRSYSGARPTPYPVGTGVSSLG